MWNKEKGKREKAKKEIVIGRKERSEKNKTKKIKKRKKKEIKERKKG